MFLVFQYWIVYLLNLKHPNLDVSSIPILDCLFTHPNLDVSSIPILACLFTHLLERTLEERARPACMLYSDIYRWSYVHQVL